MNQHPDFWLGLEDYEGDPAFKKMAENEFLSSPLQQDDGKDGIARREFLKLMGASLALATTSCVRRPAQTIIPYAKAPKEITPGEANFYASSWFDGNQGYGIVVKTLEGRPIKVEGNALYPLNKGSLSARGHAEILSLYDPDRLKGPRRNLVNKLRTNKETIATSFNAADERIVAQLKKGGVVVLTGALPSPTSKALLEDFFRSYPGRHVMWNELPTDSVSEGQRRSYGRALVPRYRIDRARLVVTIDTDLLGTYLSPADFNKQWAVARQPGAEMMRLVAFESNMSLTGLNADDRVRIRPSQQLDVVLGLLYEIGVVLAKHPVAMSARYRSVLEGYRDVSARLGIPEAAFKTLAQELWKNRGQSLVIAGGLPTMTADAVELQAAVNILNNVLENDGKTIDSAVTFQHTEGSSTDLSALIADMNAGKVQTLIIHGGINPIYSYPGAQKFREAAAKVPMIISTSNWNDETASIADFVLPGGTGFESWGDFEFVTGVYSIQQPTIRPLHDSRSFEESIFTWATVGGNPPARLKQAGSWFVYLQNHWRASIYPRMSAGQNFDDFWYQVLQTGVVSTGAALDSKRVAGARALASDALNLSPRAPKDGYELVLYPTVQMADGKYANVSWLQELPDPVTKIVWDNYLSVSPATAKKEKLREGDVVSLQVGDKQVEVPVHVQPGLHDDVLSLAVGYGRTAAGKVGNGVGVNGFALAMVDEKGRSVYSGLSAKIAKTGKKYELACPQGHHQLEGRNHVVETTLANYLKDPTSGQHKHAVFSIWPEHKYTKHKWAMSIDLNVCTGCSACVIACQSENNIPTVGKKYVIQGREMHWIRIDRYYKGTPDNPQAVFEPMLCQHCETAPCETVCPVLATVHNEEGLNDMIYNRCVGTRYCSNNCPYKVRRFNWFNYSKREAPLHMALNPDVTVRSRGVMEKCTFCVQRIRRGTNAARDRKEPLKDGEIKTACQETCPTGAIVFGDLNNPESAVAKQFANPRTFAVLEELNTQPRVRYMSRVRNAERSMPNRLSENPEDLKDKHSAAQHGGGHS